MKAPGSSQTVTMVASAAWRRLLIQGAAAVGFDLTEEQVSCFEQFADELLAWNRRINLTTITAPADIAIKHFVDSLPGAQALDTGWYILDLGSGGGFPGVPLKIVRPDLTVTLVDAVRKKVSFQKQVCRRLGLSGIHSLHARIEDLGRDSEHAGRYDAVVSRALTDLDALCRLAAPLLTPSGRVVAYRGPSTDPCVPKTDSAVADATARWRLTHRSYFLPQAGAERSITCCQRRPG